MEQSAIEQLFVEKFNKFTKPQQAIITKLLKGYRLTNVNINGMKTEFMWFVPKSSNLEHAGHVYKAFFGVEYTIYKLTENRVNIGAFYIV